MYSLIEFLKTLLNDGTSYSVVNTARSALSLVLEIHPNHEHILKRFCRGIYNLRPATPKYSFTWDPNLVLSYISKFYPLASVNLRQITLKLVTLLALISAHRVQTLSKIKLENIYRFKDRIEIKIVDRIKTSGPYRSQPILIFPYFKEKPELCVASTIVYYIEFTKDIRSNETSLLLTFKKPHHAATSQTISRWIKEVLRVSGIDISIFKSHSTRHAATSAAFRAGVNINTIKNTAGWSKASQVFNTFYNKTITPDPNDFAKAVLGINSTS